MREFLTVKEGRSYATESREEYNFSTRLRWYIVYLVGENWETGTIPDEEMDVFATDRKTARVLAKKLIERDYDPGTSIMRGGIVLA